MTTSRTSLPVLLVHGFWHGSWCWTQVAAELTRRRRRVLAADLAGHGLRARRPAAAAARPFDPQAFATEMSPVASIDLDLAAEELTDQIRALAVDGPVVAVAHSFAGVVLTRAAQTVPDLLAHVVYVAAFMPASGVPGVAYLDQPEQEGDRVAPLLRADPASVGALRLDPRAGGDDREALVAAFYQDVDPATADAAIALLSCDAPASVAAGSTVLTAQGWGRVPRTFVCCTEDYAVRPALQRRFIREADQAFPNNPTSVVELGSGHSPFLSMPTALAAAIDAAGASLA